MGAKSIETKLVLSGEKEYLDGLKSAYTGIADLGAQIKKTDGIIASAGGGFDQYADKAKLLNRQIEKQKDLISNLASRMDAVKGLYGDNTIAESMYGKKIEKETKKLEKMERQLRETENAMQSMENAAKYSGIDELGDQIKRMDGIIAASGESFDNLKMKMQLLEQQIEQEKKLIRSLADEMERLDDVDGSGAQKSDFARQIELETSKLQKMQSQLNETEKAMRRLDDAAQESARAQQIERETRELEQMERQLRETEAAMERLDKAADKLRRGWTVLKDISANILQDALYAGFEQVKDFVKEGVNTASDLEEITNVVDTAFGHNAYKIKSFAEEAIYNFGLSSKAAQEYAGKLGAAFNALGLEDEALEMSKTLTGLTGDLASFWNMSADDAYSKIFAGIVSGETEGLKSLGIVMTEAELNAFAMAEGIKQGTKNMTAAEKTLLRYRYVLNATSQAQGDFAKTSDSYANQLRVAQLSTENLGGKMGTTMLPAITEILNKYNEFANSDFATDLFEDIGESIGDLATGAFNGLIEAMQFVRENAEEIKSLFSTLGGAAVGYGIAKSALALKDVVVQMKSIAGFKSLLGGNWLVAGLTVGGLAIAGLTEYAKRTDELQNALNNLDVSLDPQSQQKITDGINAGIDAANKEYEIELGVKADIEKLQKELDTIFSSDSPGGAKITRAEWKEASAYVAEVVGPDIEQAKLLLKEYQEDYKTSLMELTGENGENLYTEEEAEQATAAVTQKTQDLITELETAYNDYNTLLKTIYQSGGTATEAEIAELETLLSRIGEIQTQLAIAQDEALTLQKAYYTKTTTGYGDVEDASVSLGYVKQKTENELSQIESETNGKIVQIQQLVDNGLLTAQEGAAAIEAEQARMEEASAAVLAQQQQMLQSIFDGMAQAYPEAAAAIEQMAAVYEAYAAIYSKDEQTEGGVAERLLADAEVIKAAGGEVAQTMEELQKAVDSGDYEQINKLAEQVFADMEKAAAEAAKNMESNPIAALFQEAMEGFSTDQLDTTALDGMLENLFKAEDFLEKGRNVGEYLYAGVGEATETAAGEVTGQLDEIAQNLATKTGELETSAGSTGLSIMQAMAKGVSDNQSLIDEEISGIQGGIEAWFSNFSITIPIHFEVDPLPTIDGTGNVEGAAENGRRLTSGATSSGNTGRLLDNLGTTKTTNFNIVQNIIANETSYVGQQQEARRQIRDFARSLNN